MLASSLRYEAQATVSNKPGHRGEHEGNRKTIARGMPGETGVTVVTMLVCFVLFRTRGFGCIERPAFPAPSEVSGRDVHKHNSGISGPSSKWLESSGRPSSISARRPNSSDPKTSSLYERCFRTSCSCEACQ